MVVVTIITTIIIIIEASNGSNNVEDELDRFYAGQFENMKAATKFYATDQGHHYKQITLKITHHVMVK